MNCTGKTEDRKMASAENSTTLLTSTDYSVSSTVQTPRKPNGIKGGREIGHTKLRSIHEMLREQRNVSRHRSVRRFFRVDVTGSPTTTTRSLEASRLTLSDEENGEHQFGFVHQLSHKIKRLVVTPQPNMSRSKPCSPLERRRVQSHSEGTAVFSAPILHLDSPSNSCMSNSDTSDNSTPGGSKRVTVAQPTLINSFDSSLAEEHIRRRLGLEDAKQHSRSIDSVLSKERRNSAAVKYSEARKSSVPLRASKGSASERVARGSSASRSGVRLPPLTMAAQQSHDTPLLPNELPSTNSDGGK